MTIKPIKTKIFLENEDLIGFIKKNVKKIPKRSVLVVTSKIVALAEGRTDLLANKNRILIEESEAVLKTKLTTLTLKDGMLMAAAGIDESNANGKIVLLPMDSYKSAARIRAALRKVFKLKELGVLITDSRTYPLRQGVTGIALGFAGFEGVRDYRGVPDIFGRKLTFTTTNIADCLATSGVLVMGEGSERYPLALITGAPVEFTDKKISQKDVAISIEDDLYKPLLRPIIRKIKK